MSTGGGQDVFVHATVLERAGLVGGQKAAFGSRRVLQDRT